MKYFKGDSKEEPKKNVSAVLMSQDSYIISTQGELNLNRMEFDEEEESSSDAEVRQNTESEDYTLINREIIEKKYFWPMDKAEECEFVVTIR